MKKDITITSYFKTVLVILLLISGKVFSQAGMMNNNPDKSAVLDLNEPNKGLLIPRISLPSTSDKNAINGKAPANSLLIYNTNNAISGTGAKGSGFYYWDDASALWKRVITIADTTAWTLGGNKNRVEKKLGTLDSTELPIVVNSIERMRIGARTDTTLINLGVGNTPARLSMGKYASANVGVPHISLYESGSSLYGFGVTSGQLNYLSNGTHVFYSGGTSPVEELRVQAGNSTNKSSLKIAHIPEGNNDDSLLVTRNNEVYRAHSPVFKYESQSGVVGDTLKIVLTESYVQDLIYIRMERGGYFGTAVFSVTRGVIWDAVQRFDRRFYLTYLSGGVEPIDDIARTKYTVTNITSPAANQPNHLKLAYPNAPTTYGTNDGFDFEIWITADATTKTLNIRNLSTFSDPGWQTDGSRRFYVTLTKIY